MGKVGRFTKNVGVLALGNLASRVISFLLVPLYTAVLSSSDIGVYDIVYNVAGLLLPVLTLNVADAVLRFPMDENSDPGAILKIGLLVTLASALLVMMAQALPGVPWSSAPGVEWVFPLYVANALYSLLLLFCRGIERLNDVALAGMLSALVTAVGSIVLLLWLRRGLNGYFIANIAGMMVPTAFMLFRVARLTCGSGRITGGLAKRMLAYSSPLMATVLGWWLVGFSDRYVVSYYCGVAVNGMYSIAYRIPGIINVVQGVIIQSWQLSAVKEYDANDEDGFLMGVYHTVEVSILLLCSAVCICTPLIARLLFRGEFYDAWRYVPLLLAYAFMNTMSGMLGGLLLAEKNSVPIALSVVAGGVVNLLAGISLVQLLGPQGAAISSVLAGVTTWAWRCWAVHGQMKVRLRPFRTVMAVTVLCLQGAALLFGEVLVAIGLVCVFAAVYFEEISTGISKVALKFEV